MTHFQLKPKRCYAILFTWAISCSFTVLQLRAESIQQLFRLTASQSFVGDRFGENVDIDGGVAIISAIGDAEFGEDSGAAYLFDVTTGEELFRLTASDGYARQDFGSDVAISGNLAMVAAWSDSEAGEYAGAVYVFDVATGTELYKLIPDDPSDVFGGTSASFGASVAMDGTIGIVGSVLQDAAYIYDLSSGEKLFDLAPDDPHPPSNGFPATIFGWGVDLSGELAVVGAYADSEFGDNSGAAYIFDATNGEMLHKLSASDADANQFFASPGNIAIDQDTIVIGALESNNRDRGKAHIFDAEAGEEQIMLETPPDDMDNNFAGAVAMSGNSVILTASNDTVDGKLKAGSAYLYDLDSGELQKFYYPDGNASDHFGADVAIDGDLAIIGSWPVNRVCTPFCEDTPTDAGAAYIFRIGTFEPGDVNQDGTVDVMDIDELAHGIRVETSDTVFDLNGDGLVTLSDHQLLIKEILNTWIGDSNLDGEFNSIDFVKIFQAGEYDDNIIGNSTWSTGDWNADGDFDSGDFVVAFQGGGFEAGPRKAVASVPEPSSVLLITIAIFGLAQRRRLQAPLAHLIPCQLE